MTPLERRYRRLVRLLPAGYRAEWEEDMVGTFLSSRRQGDPDVDPDFDSDFDAEYGRPDWREVASVAGLAVRLRLGGVHAPPRSFVRGEVVRGVALAGLLVHAVGAVVGVVSLLLAQVRFPAYAVSDVDTVAALLGLLWAGSYLALVSGHRRAAVWLGVTGMVPVGWSAVTDVAVASAAGRVLVAALPLLALTAFHDDAPPVRARPWLIALPAGVAVVTGMAFLVQTPAPIALDWPGMVCAATVVAAVSYLVTGRRGPWAGTLSVLAVAALGERVLTLVDYARLSVQDSATHLLITTGVLEAAALVLVTAPLVVRHAALINATPRESSRNPTP